MADPETWTTETQPMVEVWTEAEVAANKRKAGNLGMRVRDEAGPPAPLLDSGPRKFRPARAGDVIEVPCPECGGEGGVPCDVCRRQQCAMCTDCDGSGTLRVLLTEDPVEQWVHDYGHHGWLCTGVPETGDET